MSACGRVTLVDLPGHGRSHGLSLGSLDEVVESLAGLLQPETVIIGWSLGGLVAQALAQAYPELVKGLVLVASTPKFTQSDTWKHGLADDVLQNFAANLQQDYQQTVKRFFALQFMGVRHDPAAMRRLQQDILSTPADLLALEQGLNILATADFTARRPEIPTLWLLGKLDRLIPVSLLEELRQWGGNHQVELMNKAAHVPFVTHPTEFLASVVPFIRALHNE